MERWYLDGTNAAVTRTDVYLVKITREDGTTLDELEPRRLFPVTYPEKYITLVDKDEHEVAMVRDVAALDPASAEALRAVFRETYRIPEIRKIFTSQQKFGYLMWETETNQGPVRFQIRNIRHDIKKIGKRILVRDANDNRYVIPDCDALDKHSRGILFSYL